MKRSTLSNGFWGGALLVAVGGLVGPSLASDGVWTNDANANWHDSTRWLGGVIANGVGRTGDFSRVNITADRTVTIDGAQTGIWGGGRTGPTVGTLIFGDTVPSHGWTIARINLGTLRLEVSSGQPVVIVTTNVLPATKAVIINAVLEGNQGFVKTGGGVLTLNTNNISGDIYVTEGTLRVPRDLSLGAPDNDVYLSGNAVLHNTATWTAGVNRVISIGEGGGTLHAGGGWYVTNDNQIVGTNLLTKTGSSTLYLRADMSAFSGPWLILDGEVQVERTNAFPLGSVVVSNGKFTVSGVDITSDGSRFTFLTNVWLDIITGPGALRFTNNPNGAIKTLGSATSYGQVLGEPGVTVKLAPDATIGRLKILANLELQGNATLHASSGAATVMQILGNITEEGGTQTRTIYKTGGGDFTLSGTNSFGTLSISTGKIFIGSARALPNSVIVSSTNTILADYSRLVLGVLPDTLNGVTLKPGGLLSLSNSLSPNLSGLTYEARSGLAVESSGVSFTPVAMPSMMATTPWRDMILDMGLGGTQWFGQTNDNLTLRIAGNCLVRAGWAGGLAISRVVFDDAADGILTYDSSRSSMVASTIDDTVKSGRMRMVIYCRDSGTAPGASTVTVSGSNSNWFGGLTVAQGRVALSNLYARGRGETVVSNDARLQCMVADLDLADPPTMMLPGSWLEWPEVFSPSSSARPPALVYNVRLPRGIILPEPYNLAFGSNAIVLVNSSVSGSGTNRADMTLGPAVPDTTLTINVMTNHWVVYGRVSDGPNGRLAILKGLVGTLLLTATNTFSGGLTVQRGTVVAGSVRSLGLGPVTVLPEAGATTATARVVLNAAGIDSSASVYLYTTNVAGTTVYGVVEIASGVTNRVSGLYLDGVPQPLGTYGSTASPATYKDDRWFAGSGVLQVTGGITRGTLWMVQ